MLKRPPKSIQLQWVVVSGEGTKAPPCATGNDVESRRGGGEKRGRREAPRVADICKTLEGGKSFTGSADSLVVVFHQIVFDFVVQRFRDVRPVDQLFGLLTGDGCLHLGG